MDHDEIMEYLIERLEEELDREPTDAELLAAYENLPDHYDIEAFCDC